MTSNLGVRSKQFIVLSKRVEIDVITINTIKRAVKYIQYTTGYSLLHIIYITYDKFSDINAKTYRWGFLWKNNQI